MPGRKDCVSVFKDGKKKSECKRKYCLAVREAFEVFKEENPDVKMGKSTFAALRPAHVVPVCDKDQNVCCCKYHENFELLSQGLCKIKQDLPDSKTLVHLAV